MSSERPSKQDKAYWRGESKWQDKWESEKPETPRDEDYGQYQITMQRIRGYAAGWIDGVAWARRQKRKSPVEPARK